MHPGDPTPPAAVAAAGGSGSAAKAGGRPAPPRLAAAAGGRGGGGSAAAFPSFIPPPPPAAGAATPPPPPPPAPIARAAAAASPAPPASTAAGAASGARPVGSVPISLGLLRQLRSLDECGRLRVSVRLERQSLNDTELEMVADWFQVRGGLEVAAQSKPNQAWRSTGRVVMCPSPANEMTSSSESPPSHGNASRAR